MKKLSLLLLIPIFLLEAIIRLILIIFDLMVFLTTKPLVWMRDALAKVVFKKWKVEEGIPRIEDVLNNPKYKPIGRWEK